MLSISCNNLFSVSPSLKDAVDFLMTLLDTNHLYHDSSVLNMHYQNLMDAICLQLYWTQTDGITRHLLFRMR